MTISARSAALTIGCFSLVTSFSILAHEGGKAENCAYVGDNSMHLITDGFGGCVRTGSWSKDKAQVECDPDLVAKAPAPEPAPAMAEAPAPAPAPVVPQTITKNISLGANALFDVNKASLKAEGMAQLDQLASDLAKLKSVDEIQIVGHTDSTGAASYNQKLSERRAASVKNYLVGKGVDPSIITTSGMGETQPVADNRTRAGRAQNRRVDIMIKGTQVE